MLKHLQHGKFTGTFTQPPFVHRFSDESVLHGTPGVTSTRFVMNTDEKRRSASVNTCFRTTVGTVLFFGIEARNYHSFTSHSASIFVLVRYVCTI